MPPAPAAPAASRQLAPALTDARFGKYGDPTVGIIFGGSGVGKSTSLLFSFAGPTVYLALPGALKSSVDTVGWSPREERREFPIFSAQEGTTFLRILRDKPGHGILTVVIDDLSILLANTLRVIEANPPKTKRGEVDNFAVWDMVGDAWVELISTAREAGVHVWFSGHVRPPGSDKDGNFWPGGVQTPSQKLTARTPYLADCIWRVIPAEGTPEAGTWKHVAECRNGDIAWTEKDRHGYDGVFPLNPGEALRGAGYILPRPKGLEWIDGVAEHVARAIIAGTSRDEVCRETAKKLLSAGKDRRHIAWAVFRDGVDRAAFRTLRTQKWAALGL